MTYNEMNLYCDDLITLILQSPTSSVLQFAI